MVNYDKRNFRPVEGSTTGDAGAETVFRYRQMGETVTADYCGGEIVCGQLIAICSDDGTLEMRYQHINQNGEMMTGVCRSTPELLPDGRLRLHESWQWTCGDRWSGTSILEEF